MSDGDRVHERQYRWNDPESVARAFFGRAGLDALRALQSGEIPEPGIVTTMGMRLVRVAEGAVTFAFTPQPWMCNPMGVIHGGALATVIDTALTCCIFTKLPAGKAATTTDLQVRYLRPLFPGGPEIFVDGVAVYVGNTYGTAEAKAVDASGKLYGHATTGVAIVTPRDFTRRSG